MITCFEKLDNNNTDEIINKAARILKKGGLVAFPTETVYGLGANGLNAEACRKIYEAKGRPSDNPLILHIGDIKQLYDIVVDIPDNAKKLIDSFWPGPMTGIFNKSNIVPSSVCGGLNTVAVRFPSNETAKKLILASGVPLAAPSANTSGKPSPTKAEHVQHDMNGKIDMIIDGGECDFGIESTIVDFTEKIPVILRPGAITKEMLENVVGKIVFDKAVYSLLSGGEKPKAPGMKYKHYAPEADIVLVNGSAENVVKKINSLLSEDFKNGLKSGVMCRESNLKLYNSKFVLSFGNSADTAGKVLFDNLRKFDDISINKVYSETFDESNVGMAVMNRLKKAAGYKIINV